ncbi:hypothetical protein ITR00_06385 [Pediococcus pentosaceus]|uniref:hypothetical protein n=1 Tax=Pediococcus pentosaceus TaxID=1255 RepID=UPI00190973FE|nr:hypothetical protein [Pediococcus pentosaceus]MBF7125687.1 hypothetical protein [Pediococcus pentosaceus]WPK17260.1 hypothetical protein R6U75_03730 [Pediococcus pentosaceus]
MNYKSQHASESNIKRFYTGALVAASVLATVSLAQVSSANADEVSASNQATTTIAKKDQAKVSSSATSTTAVKNQASTITSTTTEKTSPSVASVKASSVTKATEASNDVKKASSQTDAKATSDEKDTLDTAKLEKAVSYGEYVLKWLSNADDNVYELEASPVKGDLQKARHELESPEFYTQDDIDSITEYLNNDASFLAEELASNDVPKPGETTTDKTVLQTAIKKAEAIINDASKYTSSSIANLKQALNSAKDVNANDKATQTQVDAATSALNTAIKGVKPADDNKDNDSNKGNDDTKGNDSNKGNNSNKNNDDTKGNDNDKSNNGAKDNSSNNNKDTSKVNNDTDKSSGSKKGNKNNTSVVNKNGKATANNQNSSSTKTATVVAAGQSSSSNNSSNQTDNTTNNSEQLLQTGERKQHTEMVAGFAGLMIAALGVLGIKIRKRRN